MKGRDLRAALQFAGTTCDVTILPHRTRLQTCTWLTQIRNDQPRGLVVRASGY